MLRHAVSDVVVVKPEFEDRDDELSCELPLDLRVNVSSRYSASPSPAYRDSGTESDDSCGRSSPDVSDRKPYKKRIINRYSKSFPFLCLYQQP